MPYFFRTFTSQQRAIFALILLALIWGYNWVVMKIALRDAAAFDFATLRNLLGAISLFLLLTRHD